MESQFSTVLNQLLDVLSEQVELSTIQDCLYKDMLDIEKELKDMDNKSPEELKYLKKDALKLENKLSEYKEKYSTFKKTKYLRIRDSFIMPGLEDFWFNKGVSMEERLNLYNAIKEGITTEELCKISPLFKEFFIKK